MAEAPTPLTWENSTGTEPSISSSLPEQVVSCLQNARFLHLATCTDLQPHVSLMNYTYLPSHPYTTSSHASAPTNANEAATSLPSGPIIIMTTNPSSRKTLNLLSNPNVSLLVHDWVSTRPPNTNRSSSPTNIRGGGAGAGPSSLASLLMGMNSSAMGSISATINGTARVLERGSEVERWCKRQHLENNTFEEGAEGGGGGGGGLLSSSPPGDGGRGCYIEGEDVRVVVVLVREGRIADWRGGVKDWKLSDETESMVNGV